ncbi:MAG TPA: hypothetical protein VFM15_09940 [Gammaproteobacteria bacterium]|nr:hypothetical protein [Gammaproteobacteria bacterium]
MNQTSADKLDAALASLPRDIPPPRDLWPEIAGRITARHAAHRTRAGWSYAGAVAAVLVVAVSIVWVMPMQTGTPGNADIAVTVPAGRSTATGTYPGFAAQLASDTALPGKSRQALLDNLRLLHDSILRTQAAIKKYPTDVNLQALLLNLYQQEARLVNEAQRVRIQTTVRNTI